MPDKSFFYCLQLHAFCGDVAVAFSLGLVLHLTFEAPGKLMLIY